MNLNQLRYFVEAATQLNFSKAAENLYISQPALSRQVRALEEAVGVPLFERGNRGLKLTPAGELLLAESDGIFRREQEVLQKVRQAGGREAPPIILSVVNDVFFERVKEFIRTYNRTYGYQKFYLEHHNWSSLQHKVNQGTVDLAFCFGKGLDGLQNVVRRTLLTAPNTIVLSKKHPLAGRESVSLLELREEHFILPNTIISSATQELVVACRRFGFEPRVTSEYPIRDTVFMEAAMGNGVTLIMQGLLPKEYEEELVCIPCHDMSEATFVVAWNRSMETPHLMSVVDRILEFPWFGD